MGKMKLKPSKKKYGRFIRKNILYMVIIYVIFSITFYYSLNNSKKINNIKFIKFLLGGGNSHMMTDYKMINIVNSSTNFLFNIDIRFNQFYSLLESKFSTVDAQVII